MKRKRIYIVNIIEKEVIMRDNDIKELQNTRCIHISFGFAF
jgi:hypothetical protein